MQAYIFFKTNIFTSTNVGGTQGDSRQNFFYKCKQG